MFTKYDQNLSEWIYVLQTVLLPLHANIHHLGTLGAIYQRWSSIYVFARSYITIYTCIWEALDDSKILFQPTWHPPNVKGQKCFTH